MKEKNENIVNAVIASIESGIPIFWNPGFKRIEHVNLKTGKRYSGGNQCLLDFAAYCAGYSDPRWVTFKQAKNLGGNVKKGEKSSASICFFTNTDKNGNDLEDEQGKKTRVVRHYAVFNVAQLENVELPELPGQGEVDDAKLNRELEEIIARSGAKVHEDQKGKNFYSRTDDVIHVVPRERFSSMQDFYGTVLHEIIHSTGHKNRLDRLGKGKEAYAKEELVAELGSMFLMSEYGLAFSQEHMQSHAAYLQSWAKALKDNHNEFWTAAREAEKAVQYVKQWYLN